jgi:sugar lactone lactonase YvrE
MFPGRVSLTARWPQSLNPKKQMILPRPLKTAALSTLGLAAAMLPFGARAQSDYATPYTFKTIAGTAYVPGGIDATGAAAQFLAPSGIAVDSSGNVYVADQANDAIRKITPGGVVTTLAGTIGVRGSSDGTGAAASFYLPVGIAVDSSGNVYVSDAGNQTIRKITSAGVVTTLAGSVGVAGGANGTGSAATFNAPLGIAVDSSGNVYVAEEINSDIRKITSAGVVTTLAGTLSVPGITDGMGVLARFNAPDAVAVDGSGNVYVADTGNDTIRMITPGGAVTTLAGSAKHVGSADGTGTAALFYAPDGVAVDSSGNVFVSDDANSTIRKVTPGGVVTTVAGVALSYGFADGTGTGSRFDGPFGIAVDSGDNLYVADTGNDTIRKITASGVVTTLAGTPGTGFSDGTGAAAHFNNPAAMVVDGSGNLYIADELNDTIRKVAPGGVVTTLAGTPGLTASNDGTGSGASFYDPYGIGIDGSGNLYVADASNDTIRKVTPGGVVTTIAGQPLVAGSTNGTGSAALFNDPVGVAVDSAGNIYVAEQGNFDIRKITPGGVVTTFAGTPGSVGFADGTGAAAQFNLPTGLAVDSSNNVYVADYANDIIRKITPGGVVTTIAGKGGNSGSTDGTGTAARFNVPLGITIDANGNLFVCEEKGNTIREITPAGVVTTLAGTPSLAGSTDGTGASALFNGPSGIAVDGSGNLYVDDTDNDLVREGNFSNAPQIVTQPTGVFAAPGGSATFSVTASGGSTLSYQWNFNGAAIAGATGLAYTVSNVQASNGGTYTVTVTDAQGSITSAGAVLNVESGSSGARLINIATRAQVGTGANILIPGFVIGGTGTETLLIRGDGPSLAQFNVSGLLPSPVLTVFDNTGAQIAQNTGWTTATNSALLASTAAQVHAFAFPAGSADSAVLITVGPGAYTAQVAGTGKTTGVALAEVYEVATTGNARLINIATRAQVGTGGNILIPGFVIGGTGTEQLLLRGDGPSLTQFNVTGVLANPSLTVFDSAGNQIATNTDWETAMNPAQITAIAAQVHAFAFAAGSFDSALIETLNPGAYTMELSGVNGTVGVALAEVYEIP